MKLEARAFPWISDRLSIDCRVSPAGVANHETAAANFSVSLYFDGSAARVGRGRGGGRPGGRPAVVPLSYTRRTSMRPRHFTADR